MKQRLVILIIAIAIPAFAFAQIKQADNEEQMFRKMEREMFDAVAGKPNVEAIELIWADDFFSINHDGKAINKRQLMDTIRSGLVLADKITSDEFSLRRYGDTAIITGRSAYFKGGRKIGESRHTQIWIKRRGQWQLVGWQGTPLG